MSGVISGVVHLDLTSVPADRQRHRLAALASTPTGVRVVLYVAALAVEPTSLCLILEHTDRLDIEIQGEPLAVRRWVNAIRTGTDGLIPA